MDYKPIPILYRKSPPYILNVDFFDFTTKGGYKNFYFLGTKDNVGSKYTLTTDNTLIADTDNPILITGNDINFDITFTTDVTIANAIATISYTTNTNGSTTQTIAWTVYHYDGVTETSIGTVTGVVTSNANAAFRKTLQVELTEKKFNKGDILRVNAVVTGSAWLRTFLDPAGTVSLTDANTGGNINSSSQINIPFKVEL